MVIRIQYYYPYACRQTKTRSTKVQVCESIFSALSLANPSYDTLTPYNSSDIECLLRTSIPSAPLKIPHSHDFECYQPPS